MPRWFVVSLGIGIAAVAFYLLAARGPAPLDRIDAESRARLDRVLEDADRKAEGSRRR